MQTSDIMTLLKLCTLQFPTTSRSMFARFMCGVLVEKALDLVSSTFAKLKLQTLKAQRTALQQHKGQTLYTLVTLLQFFCTMLQRRIFSLAFASR